MYVVTRGGRLRRWGVVFVSAEEVRVVSDSYKHEWAVYRTRFMAEVALKAVQKVSRNNNFGIEELTL